MCKKEAISTQLTGNEFGVSFSITFMCLTWLLFQLDVSVKWLADVGEVVSVVGQDFLTELCHLFYVAIYLVPLTTIHLLQPHDHPTYFILVIMVAAPGVHIIAPA